MGVGVVGVVSLLQPWRTPARDLFAGMLGPLAMTRAYRAGRTVVVASLAYATVVFASVLDGVIWKQSLPPIAWLGMAITVAAGVAAAVGGARVEPGWRATGDGGGGGPGAFR